VGGISVEGVEMAATATRGRRRLSSEAKAELHQHLALGEIGNWEAMAKAMHRTTSAIADSVFRLHRRVRWFRTHG
jgi:hypothetical protein